LECVLAVSLFHSSSRCCCCNNINQASKQAINQSTASSCTCTKQAHQPWVFNSILGVFWSKISVLKYTTELIVIVFVLQCIIETRKTNRIGYYQIQTRVIDKHNRCYEVKEIYWFFNEIVYGLECKVKRERESGE